MSQFRNDQMIAAVLGSGRPSPMRTGNLPLQDSLDYSTYQQNQTPPSQQAIALPSFNAPDPSIAQASTTSPAVSPIAQASVAPMSARDKLKAAEKSKLQSNLDAFHNMGSSQANAGGQTLTNGMFWNSMTGSGGF